MCLRGVNDYVVQFGVDGNSDFAEANDHRQHGDRQNEGQFGRDDQAALIAKQFVQHNLIFLVCNYTDLNPLERESFEPSTPG